MGKTKKWTREQFDRFCEDNFIEDDNDRFWNIVKNKKCDIKCSDSGLLTISWQLEER